MGKNHHVVPKGKRWAVKGERNQRNTTICSTQKEAINIVRQISKNQNSNLFIHDKNNQIRELDSHGNDPNPPEG